MNAFRSIGPWALPFAIAVFTAAARARAQDESSAKHDLSGMKGPKEKIGDVIIEEYRHINHVTVDTVKNGESTGRQEQTEGVDYVRRVQVLELGPTRYPRKLLLTYQRFQDLGTEEEVPVADFRIEMEKREATWNAIELGGRLLPPLLDARLDKELMERSERPESETLEDALLPKGPVAAGEEWSIDSAAFTPYLKTVEFDAKQSSARGILRAVRKEGDTTRFAIEFHCELVLESLNGHELKAPAPMTVRVTLDLPSTGGVYREKTIDAAFEGVFAEGPTESRVSVKIERKLVSRPPKTDSERNPSADGNETKK